MINFLVALMTIIVIKILKIHSYPKILKIYVKYKEKEFGMFEIEKHINKN